MRYLFILAVATVMASMLLLSNLSLESILGDIVINDKPEAVVAYAISLVKCGDFQSSSAGLVDAALVMRHSIHLQSIRNPESGSKYDYKMYAIVHTQAMACSEPLRNAGFEIVVAEPPVDPKDIKDDHLRKYIHREWCCGSDEFIKLHAYALPEPIIVHVDIDFAFYIPMDDLYDAILFDKDSPKGMAARDRIPLERPAEGFPDKINAFITRDWPQVRPGRKPLYQAGFIVARRDPTVLDEVKDVILNTSYDPGHSRNNGWGGKGYGTLVGAMAMQGLMAYYYDQVRPNDAVELNQCRFNHMGMEVRYVAHPNFVKNKDYGRCRNNLEYCEDCTTTSSDLIYNVHYTQCRKPWNCIGEGYPNGRVPGGRKASAIDTNAGKLDHCMTLIEKWHNVRVDFEDKLHELTKDKDILKGKSGKHKPEIFKGHCHGELGQNYAQLEISEHTMKLVPLLYYDPKYDKK